MHNGRSVAGIAVAALVALAGCREGGGAKEPARAADRYTVRGEIVRISQSGGGEREVSIRHEAIPGFKDRTGEVVGMNAMVMPFGAREDLSLEGLEPGDKIRFRFGVDWSSNALSIESIEELPRDTPLDFSER